MKNKPVFFTSLSIKFLFAITLLCTNGVSQVTITQAPANYEFIDMGYDPVSNEVGIVGFVNGTERLPTVFELNDTQDGFIANTLAGLPGSTEIPSINGISSDASRIAGTTLDSPNTLDLEGTTWLRADPQNPVSIGSLPITDNRSQATAAWAEGVVGSSGGQNRSILWDTNNGIQELPGTLGSITLAQDVNSNANIIVGFSAHEVFDGAAYYWERQTNNSFQINRLNDSIEGHTLIQSRANAVSPNGQYIAGEISSINPQGQSVLYPVVWEIIDGANATLTVLTDNSGNFIQGRTSDVSNSGYATGFTFDDQFNLSGFIWNPSFENGIEVFEDWLSNFQTDSSPLFSSVAVIAMAEANNGRLLFTVGGSLGEFLLVDVVIDNTGEILVGDVNLDQTVNFLDINPFIGLLISGQHQAEADVNADMSVNFLDISPFIEVLSAP